MPNSRRWGLGLVVLGVALFTLLNGGCSSSSSGGATSTQTAQTFTLSGTLAPASLGSGATVNLTGQMTQTTVADASGNYSFSGLANGSYVVTPVRAGYAFTPASQAVTIGGANASLPSFAVAAAQTFAISGTITGGAGATVTLSGAANAVTTADGSGNYSFAGLKNGVYAVTPSNTGYSFNPTSQSVAVNGANVTGVNFTATAAPQTYAISGTISPASLGANVTVTLSGAASASTTTNSSGGYSFTSLANGSYTVTPGSSTETFSPASANVTVSNANATANFTASSASQTACGNTLAWNNPVCQQIGSGSVSSSWTVVSRHGEYQQGENECNVPQQITQTAGALTITAANSTYTCGNFDASGNSCSPSDGNCAPSGKVSPAPWPYRTGDIQWNTLSIAPSTCGGVAGCLPCNGTCNITIVGSMPAQSTGVWPAFWLLGHNCQDSNKWSGDTQFDNCPAPSATGYTEIDVVECLPGSEWCHFSSFNPPNAPETDICIFSVDTNQHTYKVSWSTTSLSLSIDGSIPSGCNASGKAVPSSQPMFLIMQIQTAPGSPQGPPVNSQLPASMVVNSVTVTDTSGNVIFTDSFPNQ